MNQPQIFSATLGLVDPWHITTISFSEQDKRIDITVDALSGEPVPCPACGTRVSLGTSHRETWQNRNFFNRMAYIHIWIPCISCPHCNNSRTLPVPWSDEGSNFVRLDNQHPPAAVEQ